MSFLYELYYEIDEIILNQAINDCREITKLKQLLELKLHLIGKDKQRPFHYNLEFILTILKGNDVNMQCGMLHEALLVQSNVDLQFNNVASFIQTKLQHDEDVDVILTLLLALISLCETLKKEIDFNLGEEIIPFFKRCNVKQQYIFLTTILPKISFLTSECSYAYSLFMHTIIEDSNLQTLSVLIQILQNGNMASNALFVKQNGEALLQRSLNDSNPAIQKQAIYILKQITSEKTGQTEWTNYLILLDCVREKQLHLIQPTLPLLETIFTLDVAWVVCLFRNFFLHSQNVVSLYAVKTVLKNNWLNIYENFKSIIPYLLPVFNKMECSEMLIETYKSFENFLATCSQDITVLTFTEGCKVSWNPVACWMYYKSICKQMLPVDIQVVQEVLLSLQKLPHKYVRESCIKLFIEYLAKVLESREFSVDLFMQTARVVYQVGGFPHFCDKFKKFITHYCDEITKFLLKNFSLEADYVCEKLYLLCGSRSSQSEIDKRKISFLNECFSPEYKGFFVLHDAYFESFTDENFHAEHLYEVEVLIHKTLTILHNDGEYNEPQISAAFQLAVIFHDGIDVPDILSKWVPKITNNRQKVGTQICKSFLDLYFLYAKDFVEAYAIAESTFEMQNHEVFPHIFDKLPKLFFLGDYATEVMVNVLDRFACEAQKLRKTNVYQNCVQLFLQSILFDKLISETESREKVVGIIGELRELSLVFDFIRRLLLTEIGTFCISTKNTTFLLDILPVIIDLYLDKILIKKEERALYFITEDIEQEFEKKGCHTYSDTLTAVKVFLLTSVDKIQVADQVTTVLLQKYEPNMSKRYFPDSLVHIQKLRIMQLLLVLEPDIKAERQTLIQFIMQSFCLERHQSSVRQLMQWLLIRLLYQNENSLELIAQTLDQASRTQVSSITAFIPVLFHLISNRDEQLWLKAAEVLLPLTMGAHFKLRLYAQFCLSRLFDGAAKRSHKAFTEKYHYLHTTLKSVIKATGNQLHEVMQTDAIFFDVFDPFTHFSLQTVYELFPKLNNVTRTEWGHFKSTRFTPNIPSALNRDKTLEDYVNTGLTESSAPRNEFEYTTNIQRKITPWKPVAEERASSNLIVVASLVEKPANLGGLSRTCEVYGVKELVLSSRTVLDDKEFKSLSMSSESWLQVSEVKVDALQKYLQQLKDDGYAIVGAEQVTGSVPLDTFKFDVKTVLLLGNEREGIPPTLLPLMDYCIEIPQAGVVRSLNVHVAGATFVWEYFKQHVSKSNNT